MIKAKEKLSQYVYKEKKSILIIIFVIIVGVIFNNLNPTIYGKIIDSITEKDINSLKKYLIINAFVLISISLLSVLETTLGNLITYRINNRIKEIIFKKILLKRCKNLDSYMTGELISKLESDTSTIVSYYIDIITSISMIVFNLVISVVFIFNISIKLSVIAILLLPITYVINILFRKKVKELQEKQQNENDKYMGFVNETLTNINGVKVFQLELFSLKKYIEYLNSLLNILRKENRTSNLIYILQNTVAVVVNLTITFFSAVLILDGKMSLGNMVAFSAYLDKLSDAFSKIMSININKQKFLVSYERINELIEKDTLEILDQGITIDEINSINFENVSFGYDERNIINMINFKINNPGIYTIVGKNGGGKSTLFRILLRLYEHDKGNIYINKINIGKISISSLRNSISYLAKEPFILNDTFMNNLIIGDASSTIEEVIEVCKKVGLHEYIISLPEEYNTFIEENGSNLSSGQKQKLCFTRILLRKRKLILLDEVTSDIDGESERKIVEVIKELSSDAIIISISHKLSSFINSDKIFLINNGTIEISGTHQDLMNEPLYKELFET